MIPEFQPWPKIARLNRDVVVTEKIDGANACVIVTEALAARHIMVPGDRIGENYASTVVGPGSPFVVTAQSRKRIITPEADNFGFARWVHENAAELAELGEGYHFGEWWGSGIQRGYGLAEKRFSLFNVGRWNESNIPACCHVVPTLYTGPFSQEAFADCLVRLKLYGSPAAAGFMDPEGIVIFHTAANMSFKVTIKGDAAPKGVQ